MPIPTPLDPLSLDPIKDSSFQTMFAVGYTYSKLVDYKIGKDVPYGTHELEGDLAEKWEMSEDGLTWTFHLRQGVKWQNVAPVGGREFTSKDVACTISAIKERGHQKADVSAVSSVETPDDYTVILHLDSPYPDMPTNWPATTCGCCRARELLASSTCPSRRLGRVRSS